MASLSALADRNPGRTEADIQAGIRDVLLYGDFDLKDEGVHLESPAEDRRRLDIAVGALIIECKRDLRPAALRAKAEEQLGEYLAAKTSAGGRYAGVLSDGAIWRLYRHSQRLGLQFVDEFVVSLGRPDERAFRWWLGAVLATESALVPTAPAIEERLGATSPGFRLVRDALMESWQASRGHTTVALKRELWAKLLRSALGSQFEDNDELFVEHTYLVLLANVIGHAVVGFDLHTAAQDPGVLLSGQLFERAGFLGVGEAGFFDWPLDSSTGPDIVTDIARRAASFSWVEVDHDVLKALYQSVIAPEVRKRLGEYYTPDWLAAMIIAEAVHDPLNQRVLDPACGSGTFVFHAVQRFLDDAGAAGMPMPEALERVTTSVFGVDLHPVAVALAQTTFLLAIGRERLAERQKILSVPVYLGDSMRWEAADESVFSAGGDVVVYTSDGAELFSSELRFPAGVVADVGRFDQLVSELATRASSRPPGSARQNIAGLLKNLHVSEGDRPAVEATYSVLCDLYDQGRNHVWGFYIRNQARPAWLARTENRADVLVGNPPWLAYRYMPRTMQKTFEQRARERKLWAGGARGRTTQQDLSAFFVARSIELYLRLGGRFGFVMPRAALSRQTYGGFRAGNYSSAAATTLVAFDQAWDLVGVRPEPFPVPAGVVFGERSLVSTALPNTVIAYSGNVPQADGSGPSLAFTEQVVEVVDGGVAASPYKELFRQGAILVPRMLILVDEEPSGGLGVPQGRRSVRSRRTRLDKQPWRDLPAHTGVVESIFVRPAYLGESVAPFRLLSALEAVIPYDGSRLMNGDDERIDRYPGLAAWWRAAETIWLANRSSEKRTLIEQLDYMRQLSAQFPTSPVRVVYTASGNSLAAAIIQDPSGVVEHKLYWAPLRTLDEARYLTAILNAPSLNELVRPYQSVGAFGPRDFDKYVWQIPIPAFDLSDGRHAELVMLALAAEQVAAEVEVTATDGFQAVRRAVREALDKSGISSNLNAAVQTLLG